MNKLRHIGCAYYNTLCTSRLCDRSFIIKRSLEDEV